MLIKNIGYDFFEPWLFLSYMLDAIAGFCWLPVVWIQIQLKKMSLEAYQNNTGLPAKYNKLFNIWFYLGWPAFISLVAIFFLMVFKPSF